MQLIVFDCIKNAIKHIEQAPDKFESRSNILFDMTFDHPCFLSSANMCRPKDPEFFLRLLQLYQRSIEAQST